MAAEYLQRLGQRIRERREELHLTQEDIARAMPGRTTGNQISKWERGIHRPHDDALEQLAAILRVEVAYFLAAPPNEAATPDPFSSAGGSESERLARIEALLESNAARLQSIENLLVAGDAADGSIRAFEDQAARLEPGDDAPGGTGGRAAAG